MGYAIAFYSSDAHCAVTHCVTSSKYVTNPVLGALLVHGPKRKKKDGDYPTLQGIGKRSILVLHLTVYGNH